MPALDEPRSRRISPTVRVLNALSIMLVVLGCVDYFAFGHHLARDRACIVAASGILLVSALFAKVHRDREEMANSNAPWWAYAYLAGCLVAAIICYTVKSLNSATLAAISSFVVVGVFFVFAERWRNNKGIKGFSIIQRLGMLVGLITLMVVAYRLYFRL